MEVIAQSPTPEETFLLGNLFYIVSTRMQTDRRGSHQIIGQINQLFN